jgi:tetratricopeptide (TPR) repeat protein
MAKKSKAEQPPEAADENARLETSETDRSKARRWFERARELGDKRQYDYAIEYYVQGLEFWPDAVDDACKPLHACGVGRKQNGGSKPGLRDTMKHSVNAKDPKQAYLNAIRLFGLDPDNLGFVEAMIKNASKLRAEDAVMWAGGVMLKALEQNPKANVKQMQALAEAMEELGDRAVGRHEGTMAEAAYQQGIAALNLWRRKAPKDNAVDLAIRNLTTKLTIHKGKYQDGESFRDSVADLEGQMELHDLDRSVQDSDRVDQLIDAAEKTYQNDPDNLDKFKKLVDILRRRETPEMETKAIGLLVQKFREDGDYQWKSMADDIRIRQLEREGRAIAQEEDPDKVREHTIKQLRFELGVFKERIQKYPTDNRIKYQYGLRLFKAGRFDDAIPIFQAARADPKNRTSCALYLGRCFFRKKYYPQAVESLEEGLSGHEYPDDELGKSLLYWLGRAQQDAGSIDGARKTYGKLLKLDYNYKDVRARLDGLPAGG